MPYSLICDGLMELCIGHYLIFALFTICMTDAESKDANAEDFEFLLEPFKGAWKPIFNDNRLSRF